MTTNKPEVISHMAISADKFPEKCRADDPHGFPVIRLSDYEALQAECERWKNSASGAHQQLTANRIETEKLAVDWSNAMAECEKLSKDAERLDWIEYQAKRSPTGISFDHHKYVEEGYVLEHGFRFMRRYFASGFKDSIRKAIDADMQE